MLQFGEPGDGHVAVAEFAEEFDTQGGGVDGDFGGVAESRGMKLTKRSDCEVPANHTDAVFRGDFRGREFSMRFMES